MHGGRSNRRKWGLGLVILLLTLGFLMPAPTPVMALNTELAIGCTIHGSFFRAGAGAIAYGVWENLPRAGISPACSTVNFMRGASWGRHLLPARISAIRWL